MSDRVDKIVKTAVSEIVSAFREGFVASAAAAYHQQKDYLFYKTHIIEGLVEAGIPSWCIERIVGK